MKKIGIVCNDWKFFRNKYEALKNLYDVRTFRQPKKNIPIERYQDFLYKKHLQRLMRWSDLTFFEFANKPLVVASHLKKVSKIIVRLHRYELFTWANQVDWLKIDTVILVGNAMQRTFLKKFPFMDEKTTVIYNDIDTTTFIPSNSNLNRAIGIAGAIIPRKRVYELMLSFYELQKHLPDIKLRICGSGISCNDEYYVNTKELVKKLNLERKVFFDGHFENVYELVKWYNQIDILICNSYHESFHYTSHEAMSCGRYALSHFWDGADEFFDDDQIYLTDHELVSKVQSFYSLDEKSRQVLSERMRCNIIDKYDSKKLLPKHLGLIESVFDSK